MQSSHIAILSVATLREIKRRVRSVKNISQITSAMQMVAASKMRAAQLQAQSFRPYAEKIAQVVRRLAQGVDTKLHALLRKGDSQGKKLLILISTDKGLCGGLNSSLFRQIHTWYPDTSKLECITVGKKGRGFIRNVRGNLVADFSGLRPFRVVSAVAELAIKGFLSGNFSEVELVYSRFISSFRQEPTRWKILPLSTLDEARYSTVSDQAETDTIHPKEQSVEFLIEPSAREVLDWLLPEYIENQILAAAYSAEASEFSARMIAMKSATDNAKVLVSDLTLEYNQLRQMEITMAIQDMVTARMGVEQ